MCDRKYFHRLKKNALASVTSAGKGRIAGGHGLTHKNFIMVSGGKEGKFMDIQKEIMISKHQPVVFSKDTELCELHEAMVTYWKLDDDCCSLFAASVFYNLGRVHGIREERTRRKGGSTV